MAIRYYCGLLIALFACALGLVIYFIYSQPRHTSDQVLTDTHYVEMALVKGPIQPIPTEFKVNLEWARLGKALFNSTLLSGDNTISCASCHLVNFGGDDGFPVSTGVNNKTGSRNSPTVLNAVFNLRQFWDGRSRDLADQVSGPVHNPVEMASNWPDIVAKLKQEPQFNRAFLELDAQGVTPNNIIKAITTFEETLITPNAPIDRYLMGDANALTDQQKRGYNKFVQFGCVTCHQGRNIGGNLFQKLGRVDKVPASLLDDLGVYEITGKTEDKHVFKVPSLRNVAQTSPYFHNGTINTLEQAVEIMAQSQLGISLDKEDIDDLVALLEAFSAKPYQVE